MLPAIGIKGEKLLVCEVLCVSESLEATSFCLVLYGVWNVEAGRIVIRTGAVAYGRGNRSFLVKNTSCPSTEIAKPLDGNGLIFQVLALVLQYFLEGIDAPSPCCRVAAHRSVCVDGLPGDYSRFEAIEFGVLIEDLGHDLTIRVDVGGRNVLGGADDPVDGFHKPPSQSLGFAPA